jgi:hypothetical protein
MGRGRLARLFDPQTGELSWVVLEHGTGCRNGKKRKRNGKKRTETQRPWLSSNEVVGGGIEDGGKEC